MTGPTLTRKLQRYAGGRTFAGLSRRISTPALDEWRRQMAERAGEPTLDPPLWMAACWEAAALEAAALGNVEAAERYLNRSRRIIADACRKSA